MSTTYHKPLTVYKRLLQATKPYWWLLALGIIATVGRSGIDAALTYTIKPIINQGFIKRDELFIQLLPPLVVLVFACRGGMIFGSNYCISRVSRNLVMYYRQRLFEHFMGLPASFYDKRTSSKLLSTLIYNVEQVAEATSQALILVLRSVFTILGLLIVMFTINWQLSLIFTIVTPLIMGVIQITGKRLRRLNTKVQDTVGDVSSVAHQGLEGFREVRIYGAEAQEQAAFDQAAKQARGKELKVVVTNSLGSAVVQIVIAAPIALVLYFATLPNIGISAGSFAAMISAMLGMSQPFKRLSRINNTIQKGVAGAQSIYQLLEEPTENDDGQKPLTRAHGSIQFDNVSFNYEGSDKVLHHINLTIDPGQTVAIVGRSGSGKSTLMHLLPRFYDPTEGRIWLDGELLAHYRLKDLRRQMALVSQNVVLFNATIADNIAYGEQRDVSRQAIEQAASLACVDEFAYQMSHGLDTLIGENGVSLSGGQRQRIAIARAFLKDAPILLLDEATSALDAQTEQSIQKALMRLTQNRTTIVVAHRLSTVKQAHQIVVLKDGKLVERGTHRTLIQNRGEYAALYGEDSEQHSNQTEVTA